MKDKEAPWGRKKDGTPRKKGGRPRGPSKVADTRMRFSIAFFNDLQKDFAKHGKKVIEDVREKDPKAYMQIVAQMQPKQQETKVEDVTEDKPALGTIDLANRLAAIIARAEQEGAGGAGTGAGDPDMDPDPGPTVGGVLH
jgi:hypothetical protein